MKFASYNVQYGLGRDGIYDLDRIAREVEGADVIALQEVTRGFGRNAHADMVAGLQALFPLYHAAYHAPVDMHLAGEVRDGRMVSHRFQFGNMVLSRHPILSLRTLLLPRSRTFDRVNLQRSAIECLIDAPGGAIRLYTTHLDHTAPDERIRQIETLRDWIDAAPGEGLCVTGAPEFGIPDSPVPDDYVLLGDFNLEPGSPEHDALFGRKDAFFGRVLRAATPVDAMERLCRYTPETHSWIGEDGSRMLLDYAAVSASLAGRLVDVRFDETASGSDHLPLWLELA